LPPSRESSPGYRHDGGRAAADPTGKAPGRIGRARRRTGVTPASSKARNGSGAPPGRSLLSIAEEARGCSMEIEPDSATLARVTPSRERDTEPGAARRTACSAILAFFVATWLLASGHGFFGRHDHAPHAAGMQVGSTEGHPLGHDESVCGICQWAHGPQVVAGASPFPFEPAEVGFDPKQASHAPATRARRSPSHPRAPPSVA
jgi:DUF2946 family protein